MIPSWRKRKRQERKRRRYSGGTLDLYSRPLRPQPMDYEGLEPGRWTTKRPDETHAEAMNRLTQGDGEPLDTHPYGHLNRPVPRFRGGGEPPSSF